MTSTTTQSQIKTTITALLLSFFACGNALLADDTEVYFGAQTAQSTSFPNVMFILDTSGSMGNTDNTGVSRIDRMKNAVMEILDTATNINVGLMRFNGYNSGGSILFPITYIDKELCPDGVCGGSDTNVSLSVRVNDSNDDASESVDTLAVDTSHHVLTMFSSSGGSASEETKTFPVVHADDDAEQRVDNGYLMLTSWDLDGFYDNSWQRAEQVMGIRFANIDIPQGVSIVESKMIIQGDRYSSRGLVGATIYGEDIIDSPRFSDVDGKRILDRDKTVESVSWRDIPFPISSNNELLETPDLTSIIESRIGDPAWTSGNAITLLLENDDAVSSADSYHYRSFKPYGYTSEVPKLQIKYTSGSVEAQKIGLRFNDVRIPQGVQISSATLEFTSHSSRSGSTNAVISGQDSDHTQSFTTSNGNITGRAKTNASVNWNPENWLNEGEVYQTSDIKDIIQEIVDRPGWCGGNSLALLLEGTGLREAVSFDQNPNEAPVLKVDFDATSIPAGGGCTVSQAVSSIAVSSDDVEQRMDGRMRFTSTDLELPKDRSREQIVGMRFRNLTIPQGAQITNAKITFQIDEHKTGSNSVVIEGDANPNPVKFSSKKYDLSNRNKTTAKVDWNAMPELNVKEKLISPDVSSVVQEIVNNSGWNLGNSMVFLVSRKSGTATRTVESYDGEPTSAPKLTVSYKVSGGATGGGETQTTYLTTRDKLKQILEDMKIRGGTPSVAAYYEAAKYFKGLPVDYGTERGLGSNKHQYHRVSHPESYTGGTLSRPSGCTDEDFNSYNCKYEVINGSPVYVSPMTDVCQSNHIVMLSDGQPTSSSAISKVKSLIGTSSCVDRGDGTCGEELATYLKNNDQTTNIPGMQDVSTYTIGFNFTSDWMKDVAAAGGGNFYEADSSAQLVDAFNNILSEILKVDTTFVSPGATVNQFNRLTHRNDIYFSLFKPSEKPSWAGNLKQYRLQGNPSVLVDSNGNPAIDESTGFFKDTAKSYWSDVVDGSNVSMGGAANELTLTGRKVYTNTGATTLLSHSSNLLHENNANLTKSMLDVESQTDAYFEKLLKWARGVDVNDDNNDGDYSDIRYHMGDPMHSRPVIVNYSSGDSVIFVGTNEGYLHAIDSDDGSEVFSFVPAELLPNLRKFYENQASINHPYGLDGAITSWTNPANGKKYLFIGMRRGGNQYYALDISNKNAPILLWTISGDDPAYSGLGQTWSKMIPTKVKIGGTEKDVLIVAGGYDTNQDSATTITTDSVGNSIYMVDIHNGSIVWSAGKTGSGATEEFSDMSYSMPSNVTVVDIDFNKIADQMYVADVGGQVWRFDIDAQSTSKYNLVTGGVIAKLSGTTPQDARRFYYAPDVSLISHEGDATLAISIGSGWRAHPLDLVVKDRFYMIKSKSIFSPPEGYGKDDGNGNYSPITESDMINVTDNLTPDMSTGEGWYIDMEIDGEKILAKSVTVNNQIIFTSYRPGQAGTACQTALGGGAVYVVSVLDGSPTSNLDRQGDDENLEKTDRVTELNHGGIPPEAIALFPSDVNNANGIKPIVLIGPENALKDLDFGDLTKRTFWTNNQVASH